MKTSLPLFVLTASLLTATVARLPAQSNKNDDVTMRQLGLDLLDRQAREDSGREAARQEAARLAPATYDLNHDGWLDAVEFAAWEKQVRAAAGKNPRVLRKFDRNHDRKLDDAEWPAARREIMPK